MADNLTTISEIPPQIVKWGQCLLLHEKRPFWDGSYYYDKFSGKNLPNIKHLCKVCDKDDYDTAKNQEASRSTT